MGQQRMTEGDRPQQEVTIPMVGHMMAGGQSRKDATSLNTDLLTPKIIERIGCWNVRTMHQVGKTEQVLQEMHNYNLSILGVTEARWTDSGKQTLDSGDTIMWAGCRDGHHQEGVALLVSKKRSKTLLRWKPINERLMYAQFNSKYARLSVLVTYAPTEDAEEEVKDTFYDSLQAALEEVPKHDVTLVIGDLNARAGSVNQGHEKVMEKEALGRMNDNGERLVTFCEENNLVVGRSIFQHKEIHKTTWKSPDGRTESQIDHVLINAKWRRTLRDVRVKRQADVGSDHNLVVATVKLKLWKNKQGAERNRQYDSTKLKDQEKRKEFCITLQNRFSALGEGRSSLKHSKTLAIWCWDIERKRRKNGYQRAHGTRSKREKR